MGEYRRQKISQNYKPTGHGGKRETGRRLKGDLEVGMGYTLSCVAWRDKEYEMETFLIFPDN
jgi:hypothetical protein